MTETRNRRGRVFVTTEKPKGYRTAISFEGPVEAVIVEVARHLEGCTECYEHMFRVRNLWLLGTGELRAECERNDYAGD